MALGDAGGLGDDRRRARDRRDRPRPPAIAAAARARAIARRALHRRGRWSFYAPTALRLWGQAELLLGNDARAIFERAAAVAATHGGKVDQLAIAALSGESIVAGPLAAAVTWFTGGVVT